VGKTFSVDEQDIEIASWKIAELLYGPPDGSRKRCRLDDRIKRAMIASFDATVKPERRDSLAAFDRLATAIYYSLYENRSGDLRVCLPVLECVGYWLFEVAVRLGPEFVRSLRVFGFDAVGRYERGEYNPRQSQELLSMRSFGRKG
jgi:hypothetical protein